MDKLVSVVVPVYGVEEFLEKCVRSIVAQTYTNLEIILVDDQSPDRCGEMCDRFAEEDPRIKVIHQKNMGLSGARNTGSAASTGEYVAFVDSDDWIEPDMIRKLYDSIESTGSDIAMCGVRNTNEETESPLDWFDEDRTLDHDEAYSLLMKDIQVKNFAWNKLYRRDIIVSVPFPVGKLYEDYRMMHEVFFRAGKVSLVKDIEYNYRIRKGSITTAKKYSREREYLMAVRDRKAFVEKNTPEFLPFMLYKEGQAIAKLFTKCTITKDDRKKYGDEIKGLAKLLRSRSCFKAMLKYDRSMNNLVYYALAYVFGTKSNSIYRALIMKHTKNYKRWGMVI